MNPVAESLCRSSNAEAVSRPLKEVFHIVNEKTRLPVESPVEKVTREGTIVGLANHTVLIQRHNGEIPIDDSAAPIRDEQGRLLGIVLVFRDVSQTRERVIINERLPAIVDSSDDIIVSKTLDGVITAGTKAQSGFSATRPTKWSASTFRCSCRKSSSKTCTESWQGSAREEKVDHYETRRRCKDERRWIYGRPTFSSAACPHVDVAQRVAQCANDAATVIRWQRRRIEEMEFDSDDLSACDARYRQRSSGGSDWPSR